MQAEIKQFTVPLGGDVATERIVRKKLVVDWMSRKKKIKEQNIEASKTGCDFIKCEKKSCSQINIGGR